MSANPPTKRPDESGILLYQTEDGRTRIEVRTDRETVWLSLNQMADLFQRDKSVISRHIRGVFDDGELSADSVVAQYATTAADGKTYQVDHYNLDVIISVGYRVHSHRGTQFRMADGRPRTTVFLSGEQPAQLSLSPQRPVPGGPGR